MVRTRGLGHALGHDTGRGVGRGDRDDSDDAPQRRRPTTSARRQCDVILTRSGSLDTGYGDLDDATSSEGR